MTVDQKINKDLNTDRLSDSVLDAYENAVRDFAGNGNRNGLTGASKSNVIEFDKERFYKLVIVLAYFAGFFVGAIIK